MGQARVGKDTLANYLVRHYGFERIGLADPLKRFCKDVFDFSDEQLWGNRRDELDRRYPRGAWVQDKHMVQDVVRGEQHEILGKKYPTDYLTARYALQTLGTEWGRHCYHDVWIEYGVRTALQLLRGGTTYREKVGLVHTHNHDLQPKGVVFSDLRFRNEFDVVKKAGGILIRIIREGFSGDVGIINHASEAEQKTISDEEFDFVLHNPPGLENYYAAIERWFQSELAKRR